MGLPTSREITLGSDSPFPSSLGNALQDMIIGAKHPLLPFPHSAGAFTLIAGSAALVSGQWTFSSVSQLVSNVRNPVGTRVVSLVFGYNRSGAGNVTLKLRKRNIVTGAATADIVSLVVNAGTGYTTSTLDSTTPGSLLPYQIEPNMSVWLEVQCDNAAHIFGGSILKADRL